MNSSGSAARWFVIAVILLAVAAAAFAIVRRNMAGSPERTLVERVNVGTFSREVSGTGVVAASLERNLSFKNPGVVAEVWVRAGDDVASGDLLARQDTAALERDLASSEANLLSAEADLERLIAQQQVDRLDLDAAVISNRDAVATAEQALADARSNLDTVQRLFDLGAASQTELNAASEARASAERRLSQVRVALESAETRRASLDQLAQAQRSSASAQRTQLQTTIQNLQSRLVEAQLTAPFAGTVSAVSFNVGDQVTTANTLALVNTSSLYIKTNFDESRAAELQVGQAAFVIPDADTSQRLEASVRRISSIATRGTATAQVEVELVFSDSAQEALQNGLVRPGFTVNARVVLNSIDSAMLVPLEAITEVDGESFVYRIQESEAGRGTVTKAAISVLDRSATVAAIESGGLQAGDLIAVINLDSLQPDTEVVYAPLGGL